MLLGVDYLEPNKITEMELAMLRVEYHIPKLVRCQIPGRIKSLSHPKDGEVVFFKDILKLSVLLSSRIS